jgi:hypothetical protein
MTMITLVLISLLSCAASYSNALRPPISGKLDVHHNPEYRAHGPSQYMQTLRKYGITPTNPQALPVHEIISPEGRILRRDINLGLVPTTFFESSALYQSPITIGGGLGEKTFSLLLDTGSPDLWVFSTLLPPDLQGNHTLYDPAESITAVPLNGESFQIVYGAGPVSGLVFNDTINIGGIVFESLAIGAANFVGQFIFNSPLDGLIGLSLAADTIAPGVTPTILQSLLQNPEFQQPVFTCLLTRPSEPPGFFTFGYINETLSQPGVQFTEVPTIAAQAPGFWNLVSDYAILNGNLIPRPGNQAFIDTGTPGILLESGLVAEIYGLLNGYFNVTLQSWVFPPNVTNFPSLTLPIGNTNITLTPPDFALGTTDTGLISGSIQEKGDSGPDIFGTSWLNNVYAVFDLGLTGPGIVRIGVVPRAEID